MVATKLVQVSALCLRRLGGKWFLGDVTRLGLNQLFVGLTTFVSVNLGGQTFRKSHLNFEILEIYDLPQVGTKLELGENINYRTIQTTTSYPKLQ